MKGIVPSVKCLGAIACSSGIFLLCLLCFSCDWFKKPSLDGRAEPTLVMSSVASVSAGFFHALAIDSSGALWSWGHDAHGQLGRGNPGTDKDEPGRVGSAEDWRMVSAGSLHSLAIKEDGSLWAWGCNEYGQLGIGTSGLDASVSAPVRVGVDSDWLLVSAGGDFSAGIRAGGSLWLWGHDSVGQLGTGQAGVPKSQPTRVGETLAWASVSCGHNHVLALTDEGALYAWGDGEFGQLGDGRSGLGAASDHPVAVITDKRFVSISAGGYHSAALDASGAAWLWGRNDYGQLGNGESGEEKLSIVPVSPGGGPWRDISCGCFHAAAVGTDASLWAWGSSEFGQLGGGSFGQSVLSANPLRVGSGSAWECVSLGVFYSLGLDATGQLFAWGRDEFGQLGLGGD